VSHVAAVHQALYNKLGEDPSEKTWVQSVLYGMHPSLVMYLPLEMEPYTIDKLLSYGENLEQYLPTNDSFLTSAARPPSPPTPPDFSVTCYFTPRQEEHITNLPPAQPRVHTIATPATFCYRCGQLGHFAVLCTNRRINRLKRRKHKSRR
jgi:hypothetical protein